VRTAERTTLTRVRWGGAAAVLAGLTYGAAGLLDKPGVSGYVGTLVSVLSVAIPAMFLGGLLGLHSRLLLRAGSSLASGAGFLVGCLGAMLGVIEAIGLEQSFLGSTRIGSWWWVLLLAGLTFMGLAALSKVGLRSLAASVLVSATLGWISVLTDAAFPGVLIPMRPAHVAFAGLFCLSCVALGWMLFVRPRRLVHPKS
jgi:hypothetical protein